MKSFSWLHLTDLHLGMKEQNQLWSGIKHKFFEDLKRLYDKCGSWDLVLFSGDLTCTGSTDEFKKFDAFLHELWEQFHDLGFEPKLLAVPGNHDLVRPSDGEEPSVLLLRQWTKQKSVQNRFWEQEKSPYRKVVTKAFKNYAAWWKNQAFKPGILKPGLLPGDFSATIEKEGAKLGIVGLNTAFLQLTDENYKERLALDVCQFHAACGGDGPGWVKQQHACLLLTHHPPAWLTPDAYRDLNGEIVSHGQFALHLCGHLHKEKSQNIRERGTESRRIWQSASLFGLEYFGWKKERCHGYMIGKIELGGDEGKLLSWPREIRLRQGEQRESVPDFSFGLTDGQHTRPAGVLLHQSYSEGEEKLESAILAMLYNQHNLCSKKITLNDLQKAGNNFPGKTYTQNNVNAQCDILKEKGWLAYKDKSRETIEITWEGRKVFEERQLTKKGGIHAKLIRRDKFLTEIRDWFKKNNHLFVVLAGRREMEKNSLSGQLSKLFAEDYVPLLVNSQSLDKTAAEDRFTFELACQLTKSFNDWAADRRDQIHQPVDIPKEEDFREDMGIKGFCKHWGKIQKAAGEKSPILVCNEAWYSADVSEKPLKIHW